MIIFSCLYLLTSALCPVRSVDHWQQSTSVPFWMSSTVGCLLQLLPLLLSISASVSLHHVVLGPPLFVFPCGVQVRACLVMLLAGFLRTSLCTMCSLVPLFLFPCGVQVRACLWCCWQASWGCGQSNPGSSPLPLPLWIPDQSLPGDVAGRLPEGESLPHVFLGSPLSLPLWSPGQSLPGIVTCRLPEGVANPTLGLLLFLFPCGVQFRACLVLLLAGFLRVWPIQPWVFPSLSSPVNSRSEPAWWCCWQASWGCGESNPGSSPLCLPLWSPGQSLPGDVAGRLPEGVASPTPLSSADLCGQLFLICCLPLVLVSYLLWPQDTEDFAQTAVDESPELMECCLSRSPCLRSIEE